MYNILHLGRIKIKVGDRGHEWVACISQSFVQTNQVMIGGGIGHG